MNAKERVARTIRHEPIDRVPLGELCIDDALIAESLNVREVRFPQRQEFLDLLGQDLICLSPDNGTDPRPRKLPAPADIAWKDIECWTRNTDLAVFVLLDGAFSRGVKLLGFEKLIVSISRDSAEIAALFHDVERLNAALVARAAATGADGVVIADDIAYGSGPFVSPGMLRDIFFPSLARQTEACRREGLAVFFHSDGNLVSILDDIAGCGVDGLQCIEASAGMDLATINQAWGRRLCLWGNLDPAVMVDPFDRLKIEAEVSSVLHAGAPGGGFIFGTSSGLFAGMRLQNITFACRHAREIAGRPGGTFDIGHEEA